MTIVQDGFGLRNWRSAWDTMVRILLTVVTHELFNIWQSRFTFLEDYVVIE